MPKIEVASRTRIQDGFWFGLLLAGFVPKGLYLGWSGPWPAFLLDLSCLAAGALLWFRRDSAPAGPLASWLRAMALVLAVSILGELGVGLGQGWLSPASLPSGVIPLEAAASAEPLLHLLVGGMMVLAAWGFMKALERSGRSRARSLRHLQEERARQLQAGFVPQYLLYEALGTARDLVTLDPQRGAACLEELANFQRLALRWGSLRERPLWEEVELCRSYLRIEALRLGTHAAAIDWDLPGKVVDFRIPSGSLLALLVHAHRQGVEAPGAWGEEIRISARHLLNSVVLTIDAPSHAINGGEDLHETLRKRLRRPTDLLCRVTEGRFKATFRWSQEAPAAA